MSDAKIVKKIALGRIELDDKDPVIIVNYSNVTYRGSELIERVRHSRRVNLKTFKPTSDPEKVAKSIQSKLKIIRPKINQVIELLRNLKQRLGGSSTSRSTRTTTSSSSGNNSARSAKHDSAPPTSRPVIRQSRKIKPIVKIIKPVVRHVSQQPKQQQQQPKPEEQQKQEQNKDVSMTGRTSDGRPIEGGNAELKQPQSSSSSSSSHGPSLDTAPEKKVQWAGDMTNRSDQSAATPRKNDSDTARSSSTTSSKQRSVRKSSKKKKLPKAKLSHLEKYVELLYEEDIKSKIKGTGFILQLVQFHDNLETFVKEESICQILGRVLQDDLKRGSSDLFINILNIFFCFSSFSQLHDMLLRNKVGDTTMKLLELERKRYNHKINIWKQELKAGTLGEEGKEKAARWLKKQEHLLYIAYYILLNVAEDSNVQVKMVRRNIVKFLVDELRRQETRKMLGSVTDTKMTDDLLQLAVIFLRSISIFEENVQELARLGAMEKLQGLYNASNHPDLKDEVLQVMSNLTFDEKQRQFPINSGFHRQIVKGIEEPVTRHVAIKLLYQITTGLDPNQPLPEELGKSLEMGTQILCALLIQCKNNLVDDHLISLGVNLASFERCATLIAKGDLLGKLLQRAYKNWDNLLMKLVRNVSNFPRLWKAFSPYMHQMVGMAIRAESHDYLVETLRTLGNIQLHDVLYHQLLIKHSFLESLSKHLNPGFADDDVVLGVIIVIGTFALDPKCGPLLANSNLVHKLCSVVKDKMRDEDLLLQSLFALFRICLHEEGREVVAAHEELIHILLDLTCDDSEAIRNMTNKLLDLVVQSDVDGWQVRIREKRFENMNREWIEFIESSEAPEGEYKNPMESYGEEQYYEEDEVGALRYDPSQMQWDDSADLDQGDAANQLDYGESLDSSGRFSPKFHAGGHVPSGGGEMQPDSSLLPGSSHMSDEYPNDDEDSLAESRRR
mmetsp:Transcript_31900/g.54015  ORF Transcript_31900/g.54015 Transcript_31900/m.54015 type:complete len:954 (+) Transcript_31900:99-2960(+)